MLCQGAKPHSFLDYYATGKLNLKKSKEILKGILKGCDMAGCTLVGGETAELPGMYENDKFDLVADASRIRIDPTAFDTIYKIYGKHIYPSFIIPNTTLGITEIGAIRATHDYRETGEINPNVRSLIAYNTDSKIAFLYVVA